MRHKILFTSILLGLAMGGSLVFAAPTSTYVQNLFITGLGGNSTKCVKVLNNGLLATSTADCGSGSGGGGLSSTTPFSIGYIQFATSVNSLTNSNIFQSGLNIGIGTTTPSAPLQIDGDSNTSVLFQLNTSNTGGPLVRWQKNGGNIGLFGSSGGWEGDTSNDMSFIAETNLALRFYTNGSAIEKLTIDTNGNFIFGSDNGQDIGASGASRPRTGYFGTSLVSPSLIASGSSTLTSLNFTVATGTNIRIGQLVSTGSSTVVGLNFSDATGTNIKFNSASGSALTIGNYTGIAKLNLGILGTATSGLDYTLIATTTCSVGQAFYSVSTTGVFACQAVASSAGGSDTQVQYANGTALAGDSSLTWSSSTKNFTVASATITLATSTKLFFGAATGSRISLQDISRGMVLFTGTSSLVTSNNNLQWNNDTVQLVVGTSTAAGTLRVALVDQASSTLGTAIRVDHLVSNNGTSTPGIGGTIDFGNTTANGTTYVGARIGSLVINATNGNVGTALVFYTEKGNLTPSENMRINESGNVAIGQPFASSALYVAKDGGTGALIPGYSGNWGSAIYASSTTSFGGNNTAALYAERNGGTCNICAGVVAVGGGGTTNVGIIGVTNDTATNTAALSVLLTHILSTTTAAGDGIGSGFKFQNPNTAGTITDTAQINGVLSSATAGNTGGALTFSTQKAGSLGITEWMRIDKNGGLDIGTTTDSIGSGITIAPATRNGGTPIIFSIIGGSLTSLSAGVEAPDINLNLSRGVQFAAGALTNQRAIYIQAPQYDFTPTVSTITTAATLDISGAPKSNTSSTLTNTYALRIEGGAVQPAGTSTNAYGLAVYAPQGAANNYAIFASGTVGIGTQYPSSTLHVLGLTSSTAISFQDATGTNLKVTTASTTNLFTEYATTSKIYFKQNTSSQASGKKAIQWVASYSTSTNSWYDDAFIFDTTSTITDIWAKNQGASGDTVTFNIYYSTSSGAFGNNATTTGGFKLLSADKVFTNTTSTDITTFSSSTPPRGSTLRIYAYNASSTEVTFTIYYNDN